MDVTSMLNSSSARQELQESTDPAPTQSAVDGSNTCSSAGPSPLPDKTFLSQQSANNTSTRSRTPWDAGGYALPLRFDTKTAHTAMKPFLNNTEILSNPAAPKSPKHKFSDSHSSLSSFTSSSNSAPHSRISSMSTISGFQSTGGIFADLSFDKTYENLDPALMRMSSPIELKPRSDEFLTHSLLDENQSGDHKKPGSPSDAMLISRGGQSLDRMSPQDTFNPREFKSESHYLLPPEYSKPHKRTVSAPDFAGINPLDQTYTVATPTLQPTPPPSQQGDRRSSYSMEQSGSSPVEPEANSMDGSIKCMYVENCDTGSQLRKAISHIFGRNKLCTRMIPSEVWVHFCRKHYQRSRYRNAQEYAKLQCDLVQKQIRRVQAWSDANKRETRAGVVQDWSLSVRKREQKRLDDRNATTKKRPYRDESDEDEEGADRAVLNGTAVPAWLLSKCGSGYSTEQIEETVAQLKNEMEQNSLTQIPDIEILPNISTDVAEDGKGKMPTKRKSSTNNAHKRSQSVGICLRHEPAPMMRRVSQPSFTGNWRPEDTFNSSPIDKRQRIIDFTYENDHTGQMIMPQVAERVVPGLRRIGQLSHRPSFNNIRENQSEDSFFEEDESRNENFNLGGPLPAPAPQRMTSQPLTTELETSNPAQGYTRPMHQRSQSDMAGFNNANTSTNTNGVFPFRPPSSSSYPPFAQTYATEPLYEPQQFLRHDPDLSTATTGPPGYYDDSLMQRLNSSQPVWDSTNATNPSPYLPLRQNRYQNTTAVPQMMSRIPTTNQEMNLSSVRMPNQFDVNAYQQRQHAFNPRGPGLAWRSFDEADQTRGLYGERR